MARCAKGATGGLIALALLLFVPAAARAANVIVSTFDVVTRGSMQDYSSLGLGDVFAITTWGQMDLAFDGGVKFGGRVTFTYLNSFLEQPSPGSLAFKGLSITANELFSLPLSFSWFVGVNDYLCEGDEFAAVFGSPEISTRYKGYLYFPQGPQYDGIHQIKGTGGRLDFTPAKEALLFSLYAYEDTNFVEVFPLPLPPPFNSMSVLFPGFYSGDLRALADLGSVKLESFVGATFGPSGKTPDGIYRGGVLFYASGGENVEFMAQIGVPNFDPSRDVSFSINLFYLLFEPRLHLGIFSIVPTFFWHPGYYDQQPTNQTGSFDVNLDLSLGDLTKYGLRGGVESNFRFVSESGSFALMESPYISFVTMGIEWNFKVDVTMEWPLAPKDFAGELAVIAQF